MTTSPASSPTAVKKFPWWGWLVLALFALGALGKVLGIGSDDEPSASTTALPTVSTTAGADASPSIEPTAELPTLSASWSMVQCDNYGQSMFPFGYDPHWIVGKIAEEQRSDSEWWFKLEVTVTNEYNAEQDIVVECAVTGTDESATVASFLSY